jgi:site-specific DNA-cytosine methylase
MCVRFGGILTDMTQEANHVDTTQAVTHISLCAGYGGIDLGLKRAIPTLRTIAFSEIEAFACANLVSKMEAGLLDPAPIWTNLKTFPWSDFRDRVDILSGGYPCQPFSAAGKRQGADDPRHLWPFISAGIALMRPSVCFFENVEGHISLGLPDVIEDLAGLGYRTTWGIFSASEVGAPHQRKRVFILAESRGERGAARISRQIAGQEGFTGVTDYGCHQAWPARPGEQQHGWEPPRVVGGSVVDDATNKLRSPRQRDNGSSKGHGDKSWNSSELGNAAEPGWQVGGGRNTMEQSRPQQESERPSESCFENEQCAAVSPLGRDIDGPAGGMGYAELCVSCDNRTDELRLLGNGICVPTCERAFRTLSRELLANEPATK